MLKDMSVTSHGKGRTDNQSTASNQDNETLQFAVQVGVFRSKSVPAKLSDMPSLKIIPITNKGLYRFSTGNFENFASASEEKNKLVEAGFKDAFVVAYRGEKRIAGSQLKEAIYATNNSKEKQKEPLSEKTNNQALTGNFVYKVQIGSYRDAVPVDVVNTLVTISNKGITQETDSAGMKIYYAGEFSNQPDANRFKDEVVASGIKDASVVIFSNGKKVNSLQVAEVGQ
jgi:hypothetical protein